MLPSSDLCCAVLSITTVRFAVVNPPNKSDEGKQSTTQIAASDFIRLTLLTGRCYKTDDVARWVLNRAVLGCVRPIG